MRSLDTIPRTTEEVEALLFDLAAAEVDKKAHFERFPRATDPKFYEKSEECREDWSRCLRRFDEAVAKLVAYSQALVLAKKSAEEPTT